MSGQDECCCLSHEDEESTNNFATLHEHANWEEEEFGPSLPEFLERASEFFALMSEECRTCLVHGMQTYYDTHRIVMRENSSVLLRVARRGNPRLMIPRTFNEFKHYRMAVLATIPSLAMRLSTKRKKAG